MTPRKARAYLYTRWEFYLLGRSVLTVPTYDVQYVRRLHLKALFLTNTLVTNGGSWDACLTHMACSWPLRSEDGSELGDLSACILS
jgi:hypothetical protein